MRTNRNSGLYSWGVYPTLPYILPLRYPTPWDTLPHGKDLVSRIRYLLERTWYQGYPTPLCTDKTRENITFPQLRWRSITTVATSWIHCNANIFWIFHGSWQGLESSSDILWHFCRIAHNSRVFSMSVVAGVIVVWEHKTCYLGGCCVHREDEVVDDGRQSSSHEGACPIQLENHFILFSQY